MNILSLIVIQKIIFTIIIILFGIYLIFAILKEIISIFKPENKIENENKKIMIDYIKSPRKKVSKIKEDKNKSRRKRRQK
jgi:hypothetical protein